MKPVHTHHHNVKKHKLICTTREHLYICTNEEQDQPKTKEPYSNRTKESNKKKTNNETKKGRHRKKMNKEKTNKLRLMYVNANGIASKIQSLNSLLYAEDIDIAAIVETKTTGLNPTTEGYTWIAKKATSNSSGGTAIVIKNNLIPQVRQIHSMHDDEVEALWVKVNTKHDKPIALGTFYGKQESAPIDQIDTQFNNLRTQVHQLMHDHRVMLVGDFNAKLNINTEKVTQKQSSNGKRMQEMLDESNLHPVSLTKGEGNWTRVNRKNPSERSIIDYVLADEQMNKQIHRITIDESGITKKKQQRRNRKRP